MVKKVISPQNPLIKNTIKLKDSRERKKQNLYIIEGYRELSTAIGAEIIPVTFFYCPEMAGTNQTRKPLNIADAITVETTGSIFKKISIRENPDGFLALARTNQLKLSEVKLSRIPLVVILEAVEKPGNLGAILRSCDAAGADVLIVNDLKTDIYNPNVIRASQGTVFTNQIVICQTNETIDWLKRHKIKSFATTPAAEKNYPSADYRTASALVMGAEDKGLSNIWFKAAAELIKIPMRGKIDSLNVSVATAVVLFEAVRQRDGE